MPFEEGCGPSGAAAARWVTARRPFWNFDCLVPLTWAGAGLKGQVWTRQPAPATSAFTEPSLPDQFHSRLKSLDCSIPGIGQRLPGGSWVLGFNHLVAPLWSEFRLWRSYLLLLLGQGGRGDSGKKTSND